MNFTKRFFIITCIGLIGFATIAHAEPTCDAIEGEDPLYAASILAFGQTMAPAGCEQSWSQAMRARRNAKLSEGIIVREETWGLLVEEIASDCTLDGTAIEPGQVTRLAVRCETRYRCVDGAAEVTAEISCERAP